MRLKNRRRSTALINFKRHPGPHERPQEYPSRNRPPTRAHTCTRKTNQSANIEDGTNMHFHSANQTKCSQEKLFHEFQTVTPIFIIGKITESRRRSETEATCRQQEIPCAKLEPDTKAFDQLPESPEDGPLTSVRIQEAESPLHIADGDLGAGTYGG